MAMYPICLAQLSVVLLCALLVPVRCTSSCRSSISSMSPTSKSPVKPTASSVVTLTTAKNSSDNVDLQVVMEDCQSQTEERYKEKDFNSSVYECCVAVRSKFCLLEYCHTHSNNINCNGQSLEPSTSGIIKEHCTQKGLNLSVKYCDQQGDKSNLPLYIAIGVVITLLLILVLVVVLMCCKQKSSRKSPKRPQDKSSRVKNTSTMPANCAVSGVSGISNVNGASSVSAVSGASAALTGAATSNYNASSMYGGSTSNGASSYAASSTSAVSKASSVSKVSSTCAAYSAQVLPPPPPPMKQKAKEQLTASKVQPKVVSKEKLTIKDAKIKATTISTIRRALQ